MFTLGDFLSVFDKDTNVMLYENNQFILFTNLYNKSIFESFFDKGVNTCKVIHMFPGDDLGCFDCIVIDLMPFPD